MVLIMTRNCLSRGLSPVSFVMISCLNGCSSSYVSECVRYDHVYVLHARVCGHGHVLNIFHQRVNACDHVSHGYEYDHGHGCVLDGGRAHGYFSSYLL